MRLLSAAEDLAIRTLGSVPGVAAKLLYLNSLRDVEGRYCHWGLARVHGEAESQEAVRQAHALVVKQVLKSPIRNLWDEVSAERSASVGFKTRLAEIVERGSSLLPENCSRAARSHFNSVVRALAELNRAQAREPNSPAA